MDAVNAWSAKAIDQADRVDTRIRYRGTSGRTDAITTATAAILAAANPHKTELDLQFVPASDLPDALGQLNHLKSISITGSEAATLPRPIGNLLQLELLQLAGNPKLTELPASVVRLGNLKRLVVHQTPLKSLLRDIGNMTELREISLSGGRYPKLPDSITRLPALETLRVEGTRGEDSLIRLPLNLGALASLKTLEISQHAKLFALPDSIIQLQNLDVLSVKHCPMVMLPERLGELGALRTLSLSGCDKLVRLPDSITSITGLRKLDLSGCKGLVSLPQEIGQWHNLQLMDLSGCTSLTELPASLSELPRRCQIKVPEHLKTQLQALRPRPPLAQHDRNPGSSTASSSRPHRPNQAPGQLRAERRRVPQGGSHQRETPTPPR